MKLFSSLLRKPKLFTKHWYRSLLFWCLFSLSSYALVGFFYLPKLLEDTLKQQAQEQLGWQASVGEVAVNPFLFTVDIKDLAIADEAGTKQVGFSHFHQDFELRSLFEGAFTFALFELNDLYINVVLNELGQSQFQLAFEKQQSLKPKVLEQEVEEANEGEAALPKLLFEHIALHNAHIAVKDHTQAQVIEHNLSPISFNLQNFSTLIERDGNYQLHISLGQEQSLAWQGQVSLNPIASSGSLKISNIKVHELWAYLETHSPYLLSNALFNLHGQYRFFISAQQPQLLINDTHLELSDISVAMKQDKQGSEFLNIPRIALGPIDFDLQAQKVEMQTLQVDKLKLLLERNKQGELSIVEALSRHAPAEKQAEPSQQAASKQEEKSQTSLAAKPDADNKAEQGSGFKWSLDKLLLNEHQVHFVDKSIATSFDLNIQQINFSLEGLSQDLGQKLNYKLSYLLPNSGLSELSGWLRPQAFSMQTQLKFDRLALNTPQPYLDEFLNIKLDSGSLSLDGKLSLSQVADKALQVHFETHKLQVQDFNSTDTVLKRRLLGWRELAINSLRFDLEPMALNIDVLELDKAYARVVVDQERSLNLSHLLRKSESEPEAETGKASAQSDNKPSSGKASKPMPINIAKVNIKDAGAYFADLSLKPAFSTAIEKLNGSIGPISSTTGKASKILLKGQVEQYGRMKVSGEIKPFAKQLYTNMDVRFDNVRMPSYSPYSGRYVGYRIDKGKMDLALNYKIKQGMLDGKNRLILDQFELGEIVESEEAVDLPIKLALALFRDSQGVIDIDLPTHGDMNSPDFEIGGLVLQVLLNTLSKAVTSPFSLLASLVDADPDAMNSIAFSPGLADLSAAQIENLAKLAEALKTRPQLLLEIQVAVAPDVDALQLKRAALNEALGFAHDSQELSKQQVQSMEALLKQRDALPELQELQKRLQQASLQESAESETASVEGGEAPVSAKDSAETAKAERFTVADYKEALAQTLLEKQELDESALHQLAKQRAAVLNEQLLEVNTVPSEQIFVRQPELAAQANEAQQVLTQFNVNAR